MGYLRKHSTYVFIVYRILLGAALLITLRQVWVEAFPKEVPN